MRYELWYSETTGEGEVSGGQCGGQPWHSLPDAKMISYLDVPDYQTAHFIYRSQLSWGRATSDDPSAAPERVPTIRLTLAEYHEGPERVHGTVAVPGWVGRMTKQVPGCDNLYLGLVDQFIGADIRGSPSTYLYIERPTRILENGPQFKLEPWRNKPMTTVGLRNADHSEYMCQEFDGIFTDLAELERMVAVRLGIDTLSWRLASVTLFSSRATRPEGQRTLWLCQD